MSRFLAVFLSGFIGGVLLRSFLNFGWAMAAFFALLGAVFFFVFLILDKKRLILLIAIIFVSISLGVARFEISDAKNHLVWFDSSLGKEIVISGIVVDEPDIREDYTRLVIESERTRVLIYTNHYPKFNYGDEVEITGVLKKPKNFSRFNWVSYLEKDGIFYEMFYPKTKLISSGNGSFIKKNLFALKGAFLEKVSSVIPEPHSALLGGLTVGAKRALGDELLDDFRKTGIIHIVVLSGYNITIVAESIMRFLSFLPQVFGVSLGAISIILFAIMTGAGATVVRASIMALLILLARATGRIYEITIALFAAAFLMILFNPKILVFDPSFQLSFLATLGLIYLAPLVEKYLGFMPTKWKIRGVVTATISAQIFVLPLLLYMTGELSIVALPVNLLVLGLIPATMLFGFLTGLSGFLSAVISIPFSWITYMLLAYQLKIVDIFSSLPFASVKGFYLPFWLVLLIYIFYAWLIFKLRKSQKPKRPDNFPRASDFSIVSE